MDEFGYLSVLLSIILGLAVTQILQGFRALLLARAKVRLYWPAILWAIVVLLICTQNWWSMFGMRARHDWTFLQFSMVLLNTIFIYMMAALVLPDLLDDRPLDLRESFFAHRGWFFSIAVGTVVVSIVKDVVLDQRLPNSANLTFQMVFACLALIGAITRNEIYHKTLALLSSGLFIVYIVVLFARLH